MRIRQLNHSVYQLQYHLVWGTKYRRKFLKYYVRNEFEKALYLLQKKYPDWYYHAINTGEDHVHLLMEIPPKYAVADIVQKIKCFTSVYLKERFKFISNIYDDGKIWSTGYFVSSVGLNENQIKKYIYTQNQQDLGIDRTGEFS